MMKKLAGGLEMVPGYSYSAIKCGIRYKDRLDYGLIYSEKPCNAAGTFTVNKVTAAPVKLCRDRIDGAIHAILVNSTNANACTGSEGYSAAETLTADMAKKLHTSESSILMSSTGIIGHQLPLSTMLKGHDLLVEGLDPAYGPEFSKAIMTTDTFPKSCAVSFDTSIGTFTIGGTAKGSGMIAPNMATMLAYILTDAPLEKSYLDKVFGEVVRTSFNALTIDGDMSTNDTAIILSPVSEKPLASPEDLASFEQALRTVAGSLSHMLVSDGEGVTKIVTIHVTGAASREDADRAARTIANSALVKTAFFGEDPNWGRIAMAVGYSGAELIEENLSISFGKIMVLKNGTPCLTETKSLTQVMEAKEITVTVDLGIGKNEFAMLTTDFSYDYVKINAEYST